MEKLKEHCEKTGSAIACRVSKKNGCTEIYINHDAGSDEIVKSLLQAGIEIARVLDGD